MALETIREALPAYAKDLKINLGNVLENDALSPVQTWGAALACAVSLGQPALLAATEKEAAAVLDDQHMSAAKTAAALMGMNNIYYHFMDLVDDPEYMKIPANLRMNGIRDHGIDKNTFELWALAVSALNGCSMCVKAHANALVKDGFDKNTLLAMVRIAAVFHAVGDVLRAENTVRENSSAAA